MVCPALEEDEGESGAEMKYENNAAYITEIGNLMQPAVRTLIV